ncbi:hypothetical protein [Cellulomonas marina]|uniref:Uncharacterized protein n=1 Tax=Cellulomonas marina TaxID=988821 RepID=A0A1I1A6F2_9CELL|nr:hypothetical protein [Cellulomonas marina]GIG29593.1 hypothetical protein Cma02nite_21930 [Cellulomonas marina]SFB33541.1 hypothetical protein SAMN05421867_11563 [Cellulomonas marina]
MDGKFVFGGEGAKIPGTDLGLSFTLFKVFLRPTGGTWRGYTTASNEGLLGAAFIESPVVEFVMTDLEDELPFEDLHAAPVDVTIDSTPFVGSGGTASLTLKRRSNDGVPEKSLTFFSDECDGASAAVGAIHFRATLLQLPEEEWDPSGTSYVPW